MPDFKNISKFEGLNSLRFLAALLVLLQHGEALKAQNGIPNFEWLGLFKNGGNAVSFFFVLSGFLITYLLLKEKAKSGTVKVKTFYLKRILRIWPLYFLLVFIGTLVASFFIYYFNIPYQPPYAFGETWYYFVFFLPGLVTFYYGHHILEPLWSIGVEEVFYLFWAPLFKWSKNKILLLLLTVLFSKLLINIWAFNFSSHDLTNYIISTFQFEAMALGGLGAYWVFYRGDRLITLSIFRLPFQIIAYTFLCIYLVFHINIENCLWDILFNTPILSKLLLNVLFLYTIISVSLVPDSILKLRNKTLSYLGEISYGIYMYHLLIISAVIWVLKDFLSETSCLLNTLAFYTSAISLTIVISAISKRYFENYFLKFKEK